MMNDRLASKGGKLYVKRIVLKNIICFETLHIDLDEVGSSVLFLGDNGAGKSTVLRCLAMGLCDSSSASALFRELSGPLVRQVSDGPSPESGSIQIYLDGGDGVTYRIVTTVKSLPSFEEVTQEVARLEGRKYVGMKQQDFRWKDIFVTGYGAGLRMLATESYDTYVALEAVYTLFNYENALQNAELIVRRLIDTARDGAQTADEKEKSERLIRTRIQGLMAHLLGSGSPEDFLITPSGLAVKGFWGTAGLHQLGDGYQVTITWVLDLISWWFMREGIDISTSWELESIEGIVIIDEIEQHLHPKWQRRLLPSLIERFPRVQFIVATHSPLVASSAKDVAVHRLSEGRLLEEVDMWGWLPQSVYRAMAVPSPIRPRRFVLEVLEEYKNLDQKRLTGTATKAELRDWKRLSAKLAALPEDDPVAVTIELRNIKRVLEEAKRVHEKQNTT